MQWGRERSFIKAQLGSSLPYVLVVMELVCIFLSLLAKIGSGAWAI